jgi:hypothetical protein
LQPAGKRRFRNLVLADLSLAVAVAPVPLQMVSRLQASGWHEAAFIATI